MCTGAEGDLQAAVGAFTPSTHRERGVPASLQPWVSLGQMCLWSAPPCAWKATPVSTGFKGPARQFQPLGGAGRRRGWCGSQKSPSHSRPALRRDGQLALKVRDRLSQLTLSPRTHSSGSVRTRKPYPVSLHFCGHKRPPSRPGAPAPDRGSWSQGCGSFSGSQ